MQYKHRLKVTNNWWQIQPIKIITFKYIYEPELKNP